MTGRMIGRVVKGILATGCVLAVAACGGAGGGAGADAGRDDANPVPSPAPAASQRVPLVVLMPTAWSTGIGSDIPGQTFCPDIRRPGRTAPQTTVSCRFVAPRGAVVHLTAKVRERHPTLVGGNESVRLSLCRNGSWSAPTKTATCTVTMTTGTVLCLDENLFGSAVECPWVEQGYARLPATVPPGFTPGPHTAASPDEPLS
ncbi:hypothetical protein SAMN04489712_12136 [Thermomonospora echinospora]|uniref:Uncharacterized protein n=1 Tax=Thermomonospora echinospora TaxID=1992 RepID=A0A1H6DRS4_9ACTN|nr:hypothetical protein [Thermomonospora echinospora]SEG87920.1 hypothetical protein SAMN04489712_12136 [Thermomonospora echinospora]